MRLIAKVVGTSAAMLAIALAGGYAFGEQGAGFGPGRMGMGPGMMKGMGPGMMKGHGPMMRNADEPTARLSQLKTELGIKPEQELAWDAYAKVVNETTAAMRSHSEHADLSKMDAKAREGHFAEIQKHARDSQGKVKAAAEALLAKLDDGQRTKANQPLPGLAAAGPGIRIGRMGDLDQGPGMGQPRMR